MHAKRCTSVGPFLDVFPVLKFQQTDAVSLNGQSGTGVGHSSPAWPRTSARGFTLVELLVTVALLAILLTLAAPSFTAMMRNNRMLALSNELVASLNFARAEAVKRAANVTVCKTADAAAANPVCTTSGEWGSGWLVFVDDGITGVVDGTDLRLQVAQPDGGDARITGDASFADYVFYNSRGAVGNGTGGAITLCLAGIRRDIAVNATGRVKVSPGAC